MKTNNETIASLVKLLDRDVITKEELRWLLGLSSFPWQARQTEDKEAPDCSGASS